MLDWILLGIAVAVGGGVGGGGDDAGMAARDGTAQTGTAQTGTARAQMTRIAEPQTPLGRFTTATEVRPILTATRGNWVAVREYGGQDLVYVTHLMAWRCGLIGLRVGLNGGDLQDWPLPPCHADTAAPNALLPEDGLPYQGHPAGSVDSVQVKITYDDLGIDSATFERAMVLIP